MSKPRRSLGSPLRILYIRTTDLTHGFQGRGGEALRRFYALWAPLYDLTIRPTDAIWQRRSDPRCDGAT